MAPSAIEKFIGSEPQRLDTTAQTLFDAAHLGPLLSPISRAERHQSTAADKHLPGGFSIAGVERVKITPGDHAYSTVVDGAVRNFEIHVPLNYDGKKAIPIMMMMPGMGGSIEQMKHETGMNRAADQKGFAVVYMEALPKSFPGSFGLSKANGWNLDHGSLTEKAPGYDDMNYVKRVSTEVTKDLNVDPAAKYIVGFSEGGGAAQYVAESMPNTFAGVGSVHGTRLKSDPKPNFGEKTAFVAVLGDDDNMLPLNGGHGWFDHGLLKGFTTITMGKVSESEPLSQKAAWAQADGCGLPTVTDDGKDKKTEYVCPGTRVTEIIRHGGMHAWDGLGQNPNNQITKIPDFGWPIIGVPNPAEDTTRDVLNALMPYRKDGRAVNMSRNLLDQ